jgi:hypothetical protein
LLRDRIADQFVRENGFAVTREFQRLSSLADVLQGRPVRIVGIRPSNNIKRCALYQSALTQILQAALVYVVDHRLRGMWHELLDIDPVEKSGILLPAVSN